MITLWVAEPPTRPRKAAELIVRPKPRGVISDVAYQDDTHVWVVKWQDGVVTVFRRSTHATRGGNALVLGDIDRAKRIVEGILDRVNWIADRVNMGWHGGLRVEEVEREEVEGDA